MDEDLVGLIVCLGCIVLVTALGMLAIIFG